MLYVVATRIRETVPRTICAREAGGTDASVYLRRPNAEISGIALRAPCVGQGWVVYSEGASRRIVTTTVQRVLTLADGAEMYIETINSVYRLQLSRPTPKVRRRYAQGQLRADML